MKKEYAELLDMTIVELNNTDAKARNVALKKIEKTISQVGNMISKYNLVSHKKEKKVETGGGNVNLNGVGDILIELRGVNFKYLNKLEKLIKKQERGVNLEEIISVEELKPSKLKSLYIFWYMLYDTFSEEEGFMDRYDDLIENTDWLFRYESEAEEYEYYDDEVCSGCGEVHDEYGDEDEKEILGSDGKSKIEDGAIPSPFSDEVMSRFRKNKRTMKDVSMLQSGRSDAAFEQMLIEMRDSLLDIGEIIFEDENVVHRLVAELYKAEAEKVGEIVGNYFDKLKKQYQTKDYYQYLARYCNYFPAKSLSGLSPIEALYSINKK